MFKKLLIIFLASVLFLSVTGCSKKTVVSNDTSIESQEAVQAPESSEATETEPKFKFPEDIELTESQQKAVDSATEHLNGTGVSRANLITALVDEGHSEEDAEFAVDNFGIDWMEMARGTAEFYTFYMPFSYQGIIDHLKYMQFTPEQAQYGADQLEIDWDENVSAYIEKYYMYDSYTYDELVAALEEAGFTHDQAVRGIKDYEDEVASQKAEESSIREELGLEEGEELTLSGDINDLYGITDNKNDSKKTVILAISISATVIVTAAVVILLVIKLTAKPDKKSKKVKKTTKK